MSRLVRVPREVAGGNGGEDALTTYVGDGYLERIAKYVPAETLAFSIFINAILDQAVKTGGKLTAMAGFPVVNAFVSFLAFPVWSYAIGNVAFHDYRDGNLAAIVLVSFSLLSGLVTPRSPSPNRQEKQAVTPARGTVPQLVEIEQPPGTGWNRG